jgi:hypothetical protein
MKTAKFFMMAFLTALTAQSQTATKSTSSLFDNSGSRDLAPKSIVIAGEVQNPGVVELSSLPIRSIAVKEMGIENGKSVFKGAFFVNGYSLYDILNATDFKKVPESAFSSPVDLYLIVENGEGEKVAFSWGEIFYRNSFDILIAKTVQPIIPAKMKVSYTLPDAPRLICAGDLLNVRYLDNPTKITVKSWRGPMPKDKPKDIYSRELNVTSRLGNFKIADIPPSVEKRTYSDVGYGHGMGFKGDEKVTGYLLKNLLTAGFKPTPEMLKGWIAVASAKDGYRAVYSLSEIMNRSDNRDFLLIDKQSAPGSGRYVIYPSGDFFADRDVRSVEKLELTPAE